MNVAVDPSTSIFSFSPLISIVTSGFSPWLNRLALMTGLLFSLVSNPDFGSTLSTKGLSSTFISIGKSNFLLSPYTKGFS